MQEQKVTNKVIDSYSALIVAKYFKLQKDYINFICVNSKFKETTEKLRFNPIPIESIKLFPKIQTQYLYNEGDKKIKGINNYEIWYTVSYDQYLNLKENNTIFHNVVYTKENRLNYGDKIPSGVTMIGFQCFGCKSIFGIGGVSDVKRIIIPSTIQSIGYKCFSYCPTLKSINLPSSLTSLGDECFYYCSSLTSINLPSTINSISNGCFFNCNSLKSIILPSKLTSLGSYCFSNCRSLTSINLPSSITSFGEGCFNGCSQLKGVINVFEHYF
ncbi:Leucine rich repeat containing protein BspA family protein [Entamoeba marina]